MADPQVRQAAPGSPPVASQHVLAQVGGRVFLGPIAAKQAPRVFGFSRGFTPPPWLRRYSFIIAFVLFVGVTSARIALFDGSGRATGILLAFTIVNALLAGLIFKGKSGW
jgi:hypothetical protein